MVSVSARIPPSAQQEHDNTHNEKRWPQRISPNGSKAETGSASWNVWMFSMHPIPYGISCLEWHNQSKFV